MNGASRQVRRAAAALVVAASLGFGAAQALAAPAVTEAERACNPKGCNAWCQSQGGIEGRCNNGACLCLY